MWIYSLEGQLCIKFSIVTKFQQCTYLIFIMVQSETPFGMLVFRV